MGPDLSPSLAPARTARVDAVVGDLLQLAPWPPGAPHPRAHVLTALEHQAAQVTDDDDAAAVLDTGDGAGGSCDWLSLLNAVWCQTGSTHLMRTVCCGATGRSCRM